MSRRQNTQAGFTIIELMIATLVFSVILIIITAGVISLTNQYYKGITASNTQSVARSVIDTISQDIQFSNNSVTTTPTPRGQGNAVSGVFCTGNHQYTYKLGAQLSDSAAGDQTAKALVQTNLQGTCPGLSGVTSFPTDSSLSPRELLTPGMRLANLSVIRVADTDNWTITVRIVSGDDDLLTNPYGTTPTCKSGSGSQFCAVSELTTTVEARL